LYIAFSTVDMFLIPKKNCGYVVQPLGNPCGMNRFPDFREGGGMLYLKFARVT
jgi:hypothetical protein